MKSLKGYFLYIHAYAASVYVCLCFFVHILILMFVLNISIHIPHFRMTIILSVATITDPVRIPAAAISYLTTVTNVTIPAENPWRIWGKQYIQWFPHFYCFFSNAQSLKKEIFGVTETKVNTRLTNRLPTDIPNIWIQDTGQDCRMAG